MSFEITSLSEIFPPVLGSATHKIPGPFWLMPKPVLLPFWLCWLGMSHSALEISAWKLLIKRLYLRYGDISETAMTNSPCDYNCHLTKKVMSQKGIMRLGKT